MEREEECGVGPAVSGSPREVRVSGVELRVVGGTLDVKKEVGKELEVRCEPRSKLCCVQFYRGELSVPRTPYLLVSRDAVMCLVHSGTHLCQSHCPVPTHSLA